jgi:hypothetical protein
MAADDVDRLRLLRRLEEVLGVEEAALLMTQLPHVPWSDLATKRDLEALRQDLELRFGTVDHGLSSLRAEVEHGHLSLRHEIELQTTRAFRQQIYYQFGLMIALVALVLTAVQIG